MPLDSSVPQETTLIARQVGGRPLAPESPLWKTLFPSDLLRIEGRVPVDNSTKYLLQMRLNATKELIATAFSPASDSNKNDFNIFSNFLIAKKCVHVLLISLLMILKVMVCFIVDTVWCSHGEADQKNIIRDENCI